jgi:hypothetical protein
MTDRTAYIDLVESDGIQITDSKINDIAFYTTSPDQKILLTAGNNVATKLCITSNNIGIGTINPISTLEVNGNISSQTVNVPRMVIGRNYSTNIISTIFTSNNNNIFYVDGNVGIGTTNPLVKLDINGLTNIRSNLGVLGITTLSSNLNISGLTTLSSNLGVSGITTLSSNLGVSGITTLSSNLGVLGITTLSSNFIITSGNIGIGTVVPSEKIHIYGSNQVIRIQSILSSNINTRLDFYNLSNINGSIGYSNSQDLLLNNSASNGALRLYTGNAEKLTILNNGFVGIATNIPQSALHIYGPVNIAPSVPGIHMGFVPGTSNRIDIELCSADSNGDVIIDFTTPNIDYIGRIYYSFPTNYMSFYTSGIERLRIDSTGLVLGLNQPQQLTFGHSGTIAYGVPGSTAGTKVNLYPQTIGSTSINDYSLGIGIVNDLWYNIPSSSKHSFTIAGTEAVNIQSTGLTVNNPGTISFGSSTRQMINLYGNGISGNGNYGIGVQGSTAYFRSGNGNFQWYSGGIHNDNQDNAGSGGTSVMKLDSTGTLYLNSNRLPSIQVINYFYTYPNTGLGGGGYRATTSVCSFTARNTNVTLQVQFAGIASTGNSVGGYMQPVIYIFSGSTQIAGSGAGYFYVGNNTTVNYNTISMYSFGSILTVGSSYSVYLGLSPGGDNNMYASIVSSYTTVYHGS